MSQRLFRHRRIVPAVGDEPVTGVLVEDGRVRALGRAEELVADFSGAEVVDLDGAVVLPGLYDAHIHTGALARNLDAVDLHDATGPDDCAALLARFVSDHPGDDWIVGGRWDANRWRDGGAPHRRFLDPVSAGRPVLLDSVDGHSAWLNSEALRRAGIDRSTPDTGSGVIERDEDGTPTGVLREDAMRPAADVLAAERREDLTALLLRAQDHLLSLGLTSIHDIDGEDVRAAYLGMRDRGELGIRVHKAIPRVALDTAIEQGRRTGDGDDWVSTGPVKFFADGALGSHTCLMHAPFAGEGDNHGVAVTDAGELTGLVRQAVRAGIAVATHAIGDAANTAVLDAYEATMSDNVGGLRMRIEHAQYLRRGDVARAARLGVIASMQPTHCTSDWELADRLLAGHDVVAYGWRSMLQAGVPLAFGSDAPVEPADPVRGLHAAVNRTDDSGRPPGGWRADERLTAAEAVEAFTVGAAYAAGQDDRVGTLRPGMLADLIALDVDVLTCAPTDIAAAKVLTTVVGGEVRFSAPASGRV